MKDTITLLTEMVKNGVYMMEHTTYTLEEFNKMLQNQNIGGKSDEIRKHMSKRRIKSN